MLDLHLHEVRLAHLARQTCDAHRLLGVARARRVRQHGDALRNVVEQVVLSGAAAAQRHGDDLRAGVLDGGLDEVQVVTTGTEDEAAGELVAAENQRVGVAGGDLVVRVRVRLWQDRRVRGGADQLVKRGVRCGRNIGCCGGDGVFGAHRRFLSLVCLVLLLLRLLRCCCVAVASLLCCVQRAFVIAIKISITAVE